MCFSGDASARPFSSTAETSWVKFGEVASQVKYNAKYVFKQNMIEFNGIVYAF